MCKEIKRKLHKFASAERKKANERFFKTGKGEYGEGDKFIGVSMPDIRRLAREFSDIDFEILEKLLSSKVHEERMFSVVILTSRFEKFPEKRKEVYDFYVKNFAGVNNWDLVDVSAPNIIGAWTLENAEGGKLLRKWTKSENLWQRRASIVATLALVRQNDFSLSLRNAEILLSDGHDLIRKAVGWILREVWKKDSQTAEDFLRDNYHKLSRTTLRYAIERMPAKKRQKFLKGTV